MPNNRVIQDSDEEDDPLSELPPPQTDRALRRHMQDGGEGPPARENIHGLQIAVNFDEFLESPERAHVNLSSSQQRREDRWIPSMGRGRSNGLMMTENAATAQQRPLDYQYQAPHNHAEQDTQTPSSNLAHTDVHEIEQHPGVLEDCDASRDDAPGKLRDNVAEDMVRDHPDLSCDWTQSAHTYNIFESSSVRQSSPHLDRRDFLEESNTTMPLEPILNSSRRWNTMEGGSPHDTIPFSSVVSPKATRTKGDTIVENLQHSQASIDELAMPITIEIPAIEEKHGRRTKQNVPDNDEDDELAQPTLMQHTTEKHEKRKPGRPPKISMDAPPSENSNAQIPGPISNEDEMVLLESDNRLTEVARNESIQSHPVGNDPPRDHVVVTPEIASLSTTERKRSTKEPKKKKLKRSKTASVALQKTYESDIEKDVIWVDERPIIPIPDDEPLTNNPSERTTSDDINNAIKQAPQPPKKRGRKRKNPAEQQMSTVVERAEEPLDGNQNLGQQESEDVQDAPGNKNHKHPMISVVLHNSPILSRDDNTSNTTKSDEERQLDLSNDQDPPPPPTDETPKTPAPKGHTPRQHSPISTTSKVPYRVGLSKRARIAPLLKIVKR